MTGDGVNDILAMKDADCSVAMASGSEAAAQAAQVVLLDSDFAHMPDVVYEGRRVVNNIQRSSGYVTIRITENSESNSENIFFTRNSLAERLSYAEKYFVYQMQA